MKNKYLLLILVVIALVFSFKLVVSLSYEDCWIEEKRVQGHYEEVTKEEEVCTGGYYKSVYVPGDTYEKKIEAHHVGGEWIEQKTIVHKEWIPPKTKEYLKTDSGKKLYIGEDIFIGEDITQDEYMTFTEKGYIKQEFIPGEYVVTSIEEIPGHWEGGYDVPARTVTLQRPGTWEMKWVEEDCETVKQDELRWIEPQIKGGYYDQDCVEELKQQGKEWEGSKTGKSETKTQENNIMSNFLRAHNSIHDNSASYTSSFSRPYYCDKDNDGFIGSSVTGYSGSWANVPSSCSTKKGEDKNDLNPRSTPKNPEICNSRDDDGDNKIDENNVCPEIEYYCDEDGDGEFSKKVSGSCQEYKCVPGDCVKNSGTDCNDNDKEVQIAIKNKANYESIFDVSGSSRSEKKLCCPAGTDVRNVKFNEDGNPVSCFEKSKCEDGSCESEPGCRLVKGRMGEKICWVGYGKSSEFKPNECQGNTFTAYPCKDKEDLNIENYNAYMKEPSSNFGKLTKINVKCTTLRNVQVPGYGHFNSISTLEGNCKRNPCEDKDKDGYDTCNPSDPADTDDKKADCAPDNENLQEPFGKICCPDYASEETLKYDDKGNIESCFGNSLSNLLDSLKSIKNSETLDSYLSRLNEVENIGTLKAFLSVLNIEKIKINGKKTPIDELSLDKASDYLKDIGKAKRYQEGTKSLVKKAKSGELIKEDKIKGLLEDSSSKELDYEMASQKKKSFENLQNLLSSYGLKAENYDLQFLKNADVYTDRQTGDRKLSDNAKELKNRLGTNVISSFIGEMKEQLSYINYKNNEYTEPISGLVSKYKEKTKEYKDRIKPTRDKLSDLTKKIVRASVAMDDFSFENFKKDLTSEIDDEETRHFIEKRFTISEMRRSEDIEGLKSLKYGIEGEIDTLTKKTISSEDIVAPLLDNQLPENFGDESEIKNLREQLNMVNMEIQRRKLASSSPNKYNSLKKEGKLDTYLGAMIASSNKDKISELDSEIHRKMKKLESEGFFSGIKGKLKHDLEQLGKERQRLFAQGKYYADYLNRLSKNYEGDLSDSFLTQSQKLEHGFAGTYKEYQKDKFQESIDKLFKEYYKAESLGELWDYTAGRSWVDMLRVGLTGQDDIERFYEHCDDVNDEARAFDVINNFREKYDSEKDLREISKMDDREFKEYVNSNKGNVYKSQMEFLLSQKNSLDLDVDMYESDLSVYQTSFYGKLTTPSSLAQMAAFSGIAGGAVKGVKMGTNWARTAAAARNHAKIASVISGVQRVGSRVSGVASTPYRLSNRAGSFVDKATQKSLRKLRVPSRASEFAGKLNDFLGVELTIEEGLFAGVGARYLGEVGESVGGTVGRRLGGAIPDAIEFTTNPRKSVSAMAGLNSRFKSTNVHADAKQVYNPKNKKLANLIEVGRDEEISNVESQISGIEKLEKVKIDGGVKYKRDDGLDVIISKKRSNLEPFNVKHTLSSSEGHVELIDASSVGIKGREKIESQYLGDHLDKNDLTRKEIKDENGNVRGYKYKGTDGKTQVVVDTTNYYSDSPDILSSETVLTDEGMATSLKLSNDAFKDIPSTKSAIKKWGGNNIHVSDGVITYTKDGKFFVAHREDIDPGSLDSVTSNGWLGTSSETKINPNFAQNQLNSQAYDSGILNRVSSILGVDVTKPQVLMTTNPKSPVVQELHVNNLGISKIKEKLESEEFTDLNVKGNKLTAWDPKTQNYLLFTTGSNLDTNDNIMISGEKSNVVDKVSSSVTSTSQLVDVSGTPIMVTNVNKNDLKDWKSSIKDSYETIVNENSHGIVWKDGGFINVIKKENKKLSSLGISDAKTYKESISDSISSSSVESLNNYLEDTSASELSSRIVKLLNTDPSGALNLLRESGIAYMREGASGWNFRLAPGFINPILNQFLNDFNAFYHNPVDYEGGLNANLLQKQENSEEGGIIQFWKDANPEFFFANFKGMKGHVGFKEALKEPEQRVPFLLKNGFSREQISAMAAGVSVTEEIKQEYDSYMEMDEIFNIDDYLEIDSKNIIDQQISSEQFGDALEKSYEQTFNEYLKLPEVKERVSGFTGKMAKTSGILAASESNYRNYIMSNVGSLHRTILQGIDNMYTSGKQIPFNAKQNFINVLLSEENELYYDSEGNKVSLQEYLNNEYSSLGVNINLKKEKIKSLDSNVRKELINSMLQVDKGIEVSVKLKRQVEDIIEGKKTIEEAKENNPQYDHVLEEYKSYLNGDVEIINAEIKEEETGKIFNSPIVSAEFSETGTRPQSEGVRTNLYNEKDEIVGGVVLLNTRYSMVGSAFKETLGKTVHEIDHLINDLKKPSLISQVPRDKWEENKEDLLIDLMRQEGAAENARFMFFKNQHESLDGDYGFDFIFSDSLIDRQSDSSADTYTIGFMIANYLYERNPDFFEKLYKNNNLVSQLNVEDLKKEIHEKLEQKRASYEDILQDPDKLVMKNIDAQKENIIKYLGVAETERNIEELKRLKKELNELISFTKENLPEEKADPIVETLRSHLERAEKSIDELDLPTRQEVASSVRGWVSGENDFGDVIEKRALYEESIKNLKYKIDVLKENLRVAETEKNIEEMKRLRQEASELITSTRENLPEQDANPIIETLNQHVERIERAINDLSVTSLDEVVNSIEKQKLGEVEKDRINDFLDKETEETKLREATNLIEQIRESDPNEAVTHANELEDLISRDFVEDQISEESIELKSGKTIDDVVSVMNEYHRGRIESSELKSELGNSLVIPSTESQEEFIDEFIRQTIRPRVTYVSSYPSPIAFEGFFGQTYILHLLETLNSQMLISDPPLNFPKIMKNHDLFVRDDSGNVVDLKENEAKNFLQELFKITNPNEIEVSQSKIDKAYEAWVGIIKGESYEQENINKLTEIFGGFLDTSSKILQGDLSYHDFIERLQHDEAEYEYIYQTQHLANILEEISKHSEKEHIIEVEKIPETRRMIKAVNALKEGRLIRMNDGRVIEIDNILDNGDAKLGGKTIGKDEFEVIEAKNKNGERVEIKTVMRLHLTTPSVRVLKEKEIEEIENLQSSLISEMYDADSVVSFLNEKVIPLKNSVEEFKTEISNYKDDYKTFEKFITNYETGEDYDMFSLYESINRLYNNIDLSSIDEKINMFKNAPSEMLQTFEMIEEFRNNNPDPDEIELKDFLQQLVQKVENNEFEIETPEYEKLKKSIKRFKYFLDPESAPNQKAVPSREDVLSNLDNFKNIDYESKTNELEEARTRLKDMKDEIDGFMGGFMGTSASKESLKNFLENEFLPKQGILKKAGKNYKSFESDLDTIKRFIHPESEVEIGTVVSTLRKFASNSEMIKALEKERKNFVKVINGIDGIIAVSQEVKKDWTEHFDFSELRSEGDDLIEVIDNDLLNIYDVTPNEKENKKIDLLEKLGVPNPEEKIVISYVGRIHDEKGYDTLQSVMERLSSDDRFVFLIGTDGSGNKMDEFNEFLTRNAEGKKLVDEKRIFAVSDITKNGNIVAEKAPEGQKEEMVDKLTRIQENNMRENFKEFPNGVHHMEPNIPVQVASDIYLHPSWMEAKPGSVIEANRAHNYIIATKVGGMISSVDRRHDSLVKRVSISGETITYTWEESVEGIIERAKSLGMEEIRFSDGEKVSTSSSVEQISEMIFGRVGGSFTLGDVTYEIGSDVLKAKEDRLKEDREKDLTAAEIEAQQYVDLILNEYSPKIENDEWKDVKFRDPTMLPRTYEYFINRISSAEETESSS